MVSISITIADEHGSSSYQETHHTKTNDFGMVTLIIGHGNGSDNLSNMNWSKGPFFLDLIANGNQMGSSPILSVPYALFTDSSNSEVKILI